MAWILFVLTFLSDGSVFTAEQRFAKPRECYQASVEAQRRAETFVRCEREMP